MPKSLKEIGEDQQRLVVKMRELTDRADGEDRDLSADEREQWDKVNEQYDSLDHRKKDLQKVLEREKALEEPVTVPGARPDINPEQPEKKQVNHADYCRSADLVLRAWAKSINGKQINEEESEACKFFSFDPLRSRELEIPLVCGPYNEVKQEYRRLSGITGSSGAFTIPEGFMRALEMALLAFGSVRQAAEIMRTASGEDMPWPTANDTTNKGKLLAEGTAATQLDPTFGRIIWKAWDYTSDLIRVPVRLLEDSAFNMPSVLGEMLGTRLGRIQEEHYTTGDGAAKPSGVVTDAPIGITTAATAITTDEILDLFYSVDPAHRDAGGASVVFMAHDLIIKEIRKLKDSDGRYLWTPGFAGLTDPRPDTLLGKQILTNQEMASTITSGNDVLLFGDFSKYKIREVATVRMRRLVERFADSDEEGFVAFSRTDGKILTAGSDPIKKMRLA